MLNVVYLAFGPRRVVETTVFSALTVAEAARSSPEPWRLVVYTDQPDVFERYGVAAKFVPLADVRNAEGAPDYPHRVKILALRDCARRYDGGLLYLDGDTYFMRPADELFIRLGAARSVMHTRDLFLKDGALPELARVFRETEFSFPVLAAARSQSDVAMWNAGVVGVSESDKGIVDDVLQVADELFAVYSFHIVEQLAWSLTLAHHTEISPADDVILHYWAAREELTHRIVKFVRASGALSAEERAASAFALRPQPSVAWRPPLSIRARRAARGGRQLLRSAKASVGGSRLPAKQSEMS